MSRWDPLIQAAAQKYNVDPKLIASIVQTESSGNPNAYNSEFGATGLGQQIPATAKALGIDPKDPAQSIEGVAKLLDENLRRYGNPEQAVLAYHGGTDQTAWGPKTQDYLRKVSTNYGAPQVAKQSAVPDSDFEAAFGARPGAQPAAVDDFEQAFGPRPEAAPVVAQPVAAAPQPVAAQAPEASGPMGLAWQGLQKLGETGLSNVNAAGRGLADVLDAPSEWLAAGAEKSGLTGLLGKAGINMPTADQQVQLNAQSRADYDARNPDPGVQGMASRLAGNVGGVMAPIAGVEAAAVQGGRALGNALGNPQALATAGNFLRGQGGNLASRIAYGAQQGAAGGALLSGGQPDTTLGESTGLGALLGGAVPIAGSVLKAGGGALRSMIDPFTEAGQGRIAQATIDRLGSRGPTVADTTTYVPGSVPTLAQATKNPAIAGLERYVQNVDQIPLTAIKDANNVARMAHLERISGTPQTLADAVTAREAQALPKLQASLQGAGPADTKPVISEIDKILASPSGQRDSVVNALSKVRAKLDLGENGAQSDVAQIYGVRKSINDQLETVAGRDNSSAAQASRELIQVRDSLDSAIERAAPGFGDYLKTYADLSKPINAQTFLQKAVLTEQSGSGPTLAKVNSLLNQVKKMRAAPGSNDAKALSQEQLDGLYALKKDLVREAGSAKGLPLNSATAQNLATANMMQSIMPGPLGMIPMGPESIGGALGYALGGPLGFGMGAGAGNAMRQAMAGQNPAIQARLTELLTNPNTVIGAGNSAPKNLLLQRLGIGGANAIAAERRNNSR
ncbi:transglycosylase SLT domain-containing protein [Pseudomonas veronii]|uniref:transglycosylase SLT domain-containing protein n=1 Tax=Pseudomonas veronii TaxID=76761 RepID=UPI00147634C2|nr:transglycosylase SLT domain-containing protein [Pseudomonas veronii]